MEQFAQELLAQTESLGAGEKFWLGLGGMPGAGKSSVAQTLVHTINSMYQQNHPHPEDAHNIAVLFPMDGFHLTRAALRSQDNAEFLFSRRGAPFTFDPESMLQAILRIKSDGHGKIPDFNHGVGDPEEDAIEILHEHKIVVVEGLYILLDEGVWRQITHEMTSCWYVDCPMELCKSRLVQRHQQKWNISEEEALRKAEGNDLLNAQYIADHLMCSAVTRTVSATLQLEARFLS